MEVHGKLLAEELIKKGHDLTFISTKHPDGKKFENQGGIEIHYLKNTIFGSQWKRWKEESVNKFLELDEKKKFDCVYACGPEKMLKAVADFCKEKKLRCQVSLERYMKCGFGICGSCDINGKLVCKDGPVFEGEEVLSFGEFGKNHRDASGTLKEV